MVYCFLTRRTDFSASHWRAKATFKAVLYKFSLKTQRGNFDFLQWNPHIHEYLRNLIAAFCITWSELHSTLGPCECQNLEIHPYQLVIWTLGILSEVFKLAHISSTAGYHLKPKLLLFSYFTLEKSEIVFFYLLKYETKGLKCPNVNSCTKTLHNSEISN